MIQAYFRRNSMEASEHNGAYNPPYPFTLVLSEYGNQSHKFTNLNF